MQSKEVQSLAWQNSRQVLINIWRHGLRSMSVLVAWTLLCQQLKGVQIRQYQEMVSELMDVYKEHNFVHYLNSQIPEANVAKLPVRLCGRWAEFVEGKSKRSTKESFAKWLEKKAKICESKQRWMPEKREWRRFDSTRGDLP